MLSYAYWKSRFGADPHIVGKPIQIDGVPYTVIGVMPAGFNGSDGKELLWTLLQVSVPATDNRKKQKARVATHRAFRNPRERLLGV